MKELEGINIKKKELKMLRKIGEGRDAKIYAGKKGFAYKIYKHPEEKDYLETLRKIQNNNYDIKLSHLPLGAIYVDGKFNGCILKRIYGFQIHKVFGLLSRKSQIKVLKQILYATKELTDSFIYPVDLANNPALEGKSSNVLLDYKLNPQLIDIDGSGAYYTDGFDSSNQYSVDMALNLLFLELILGDTISDEPEDYECEYMSKKLNRMGFNEILSEKLSIYEADYNLIEQAIDRYSYMR